METETLAAAQAIDFSAWGLFLRATLTVKLVMLALLLSSFWSWAIIIQKHMAFRIARSRAKTFDREFWSGEPLDGLFDQIANAPREIRALVVNSGQANACTGQQGLAG